MARLLYAQGVSCCRGVDHGSEAKFTSTIRKVRGQERQARDAQVQEGHPQIGEGASSESEEPQAGDRDRTVRGATKRRQGPAETVEQVVSRPGAFHSPSALA